MRWVAWAGWLAACTGGPPGPEPGEAVGGGNLDGGPGTGGDNPLVVRVATWNIASVDHPESEAYLATAAVLRRIDADVVGINEIGGEEQSRIETLAVELGYSLVFSSSDNPFGGYLVNGVLTRLPVVSQAVHHPSQLSGDAGANDMTRLPVSVTVDTGAGELTVVAQHWKSGFDDEDEFRRSVDSLRTAQAAEAASTGAWLVVLGDVNHQVDDGPESPDPFTEEPRDLPGSFHLGDDLRDQLEGPGIANDPFPAMGDIGLEVVQAQQPDGRFATRDESGRRIDYIFGSAAVMGALGDTLIYDARDDGETTVRLAGKAPDPGATLAASDHFPVLADINIP